MKSEESKLKFKDLIVIIIMLLIIIVTNTFFISLELGRLNKNLEKFYNLETTTDTASAISIENVITPYDTITDLTGTSWELNGFDYDMYQSDDWSFDINFISENSNYSGFGFQYTYIPGSMEPPIPSTYQGSFYFIQNGGNVDLYTIDNDATGNVDLYGQIIEITGGTDATNTDLISWLQSNATQIITGYSSTINLTNCTCNKSSESGLSGFYTATITANTGYILSNVTTTLGSITFSNNNKVATISISDVTEDFTISATSSLIYHNISYNLGNVVVISNKPTQIDEVSTLSITFQPFNNYVLPQYINVEGVTNYQWNKDTGVLTLSNAYDNVEITINAEYRSGQYTFVELIDSVILVPVNTFFNLFDFEIFGVNIYSLLLSSLVLFVIIKVVLKVFK